MTRVEGPTRRSALGSVILLLLSALVGLVLLLAYMAFRINAQGERDERQPAGAIVVLGAAQFDGTPGGVFEARLQHAVELYKAGIAPYLVVTGGKLPADRTTEAATARTWAINNGVPSDRILGENQGRTTLESMEAVAALFREHAITSAVFVSDETHMHRVNRMATDLGIVAWGSPTRTSPSDVDGSARRRATIHELAGLAAYYVGGGRPFGDSSTIGNP
jgi:uncharacterized SAM-binding protein YcdF (DUF218 family)